MSIFKRTQRKYVKKAYRVRNWREYEAGLRNRGSLTVWISLTCPPQKVDPVLIARFRPAMIDRCFARSIRRRHQWVLPQSNAGGRRVTRSRSRV